MPFASRHPPKPRNPYVPLWAIPAAIGVIAAGYFCVVRPAIEIYKIEHYLDEQRHKHDVKKRTTPSSLLTNSVLERALTNAALEQRVE